MIKRWSGLLEAFGIQKDISREDHLDIYEGNSVIYVKEYLGNVGSQPRGGQASRKKPFTIFKISSLMLHLRLMAFKKVS